MWPAFYNDLAMYGSKRALDTVLLLTSHMMQFYTHQCLIGDNVSHTNFYVLFTKADMSLKYEQIKV